MTRITTDIPPVTYSTTDSIDIRDYGAVSGTVSDRAIQAAIDGAVMMQKPVLIPVGTFYIAKAIVLPSGIRLIGKDRNTSILKAHADLIKTDPKSRMILSFQASHILLSNFTISGGADDGTKGFGIDLLGVRLSEISQITIRDCLSHGLSLAEGCRDNRVSHCLINNVKSFGIVVFSDGQRNLIENNIVQNAGIGIALDDGTTNGSNLPCADNRIQNNRIENCNMGIVVEGSDDNLVQENTIENTSGGLVAIDVWAGGYDGVARPLGKRNVIVNNTINGKYGSYMRLMGRDLLVENNHCEGQTTEGGIFIRSINDYDPNTDGNKDIRVINNTVHGTGLWGIILDGGEDCKISDNTIENTGWDGIYVCPSYTSGVKNLQVVGNTITVAGRHGISINTENAAGIMNSL